MWAIGKAHSHAAEPKSRDFQVAFSKFAFLDHVSSEAFPRFVNQSFAGPQFRTASVGDIEVSDTNKNAIRQFDDTKA
jgi:hypothetical protein